MHAPRRPRVAVVVGGAGLLLGMLGGWVAGLLRPPHPPGGPT